MDLKTASDEELLTRLIGAAAVARLYRGRLVALALGTEGTAPHPKLAIARELVRRLMHEELCRGPAFCAPRDTREYLQAHFLGMEREVLVCLFLDTRHRLIKAEELFHGTIDGATVHPREVARRALALNAAAVILAHNHPSGIAEPSAADVAITKRTSEALALIDVRVLDHIIVGNASTQSLAERGLL